jgi:hypothetical protein
MAAMAGLVLTAATAAAPPTAAQAVSAATQQPGLATQQPGLWVTNGPVRASLLVGSTLFIGGDFTYEGPATGHAVALDPSSGAARTPFPRIGGTVTAIAPDGSGGWFVGGTLTTAGGLGLGDLVHIRSDGSVDPSFAPRPGPDPTAPRIVTALAFANGVLYVGGEFTTIAGQPRVAVAALDPVTGAAEAWNPALGFDPNFGPPEVEALAVGGGVVYIGGRFVSAGGTSDVALGGFDSATAQLVWNPQTGWPGGTLVDALAVSSDTVYAGAGLSGTQVASQTDAFRAADASLRWQTSDIANTLVLAGGRLYANGSSFASSSSLYALDPDTGAPIAWDPQVTGTHALTALGGTLYAGGSFDSVSGAQRGDLAAFDAASGALLGWNPNGDGDVGVLANDGHTVVAGGQLNSVGGVNHRYLAAIDTTTGEATGLDLGLDGSVTAIASGGQTLFIVGGFGHVQGQFRDFLAEFNPATGLVTSWQPQGEFADNTPEALAVNAGTVYVGGEFSRFITSRGTVIRRALAAFARKTGKLTSWNPSADGPVFTLALAGGLIYAGGLFEHIGLTPRNGIAAITAQGAATSWNANVDLTGQVNALQIVGPTVYFGGSFDTVAGQSRVDLAAVTTSTGALLPWAPNTSPPFGTVQTLIAGGNTAYAGGNFLNLQGHTGLAAFTADTGILTPFRADINPGGEIATLAITSDGTLYVGGGFTDIAGSDHDNLAAITP